MIRVMFLKDRPSVCVENSQTGTINLGAVGKQVVVKTMKTDGITK